MALIEEEQNRTRLDGCYGKATTRRVQKVSIASLHGNHQDVQTILLRSYKEYLLHCTQHQALYGGGASG